MQPARNRTALVVLRAVLGIVALSAVAAQLVASSRSPDFRFANFFGYFTTLANTLAGLVFVYTAIRLDGGGRAIDVVRGAMTLCLVLVGVVFSLLLANLESDLIPWVNAVTHYLMPIAVALDWLVDPPRYRLGMRDALSWLALPLAYVVYSLLRGSVVHWYPYPFLDVGRAGLRAVSLTIAALFVFTVVEAALVVVAGNAVRARREAAN